MTKKYILVRIQTEDFQKISNKKVSLQKDMERIIGKPIKFSYPQFFKAFANGVLEIDPESATQLYNFKKFKRGYK